MATLTGVLEIVCECGNLSCAELLSITPDDYEHLRSEATWFGVLRGHEIAEVEQVVASCDGDDIVEKRPGPRRGRS
jgi:hypothetical protein